MWNRAKTLLSLALAPMVTSVHAEARKIAIFDFEFVDTSIEGATNGPRADESARLAWLDHVIDIGRVVDKRVGFPDQPQIFGCEEPHSTLEPAAAQNIAK